MLEFPSDMVVPICKVSNQYVSTQSIQYVNTIKKTKQTN